MSLGFLICTSIAIRCGIKAMSPVFPTLLRIVRPITKLRLSLPQTPVTVTSRILAARPRLWCHPVRTKLIVHREIPKLSGARSSGLSKSLHRAVVDGCMTRQEIRSEFETTQPVKGESINSRAATAGGFIDQRAWSFQADAGRAALPSRFSRVGTY